MGLADAGRLSTVVVQRFCKPKVGGSNPSAGTNKINELCHCGIAGMTAGYHRATAGGRELLAWKTLRERGCVPNRWAAAFPSGSQRFQPFLKVEHVGFNHHIALPCQRVAVFR